MLIMIVLMAMATVISLVIFKGITWKETVLQLVVSSTVIALIFTGASYMSTSDTKFVNGTVSAKNNVRKQCSIGWRSTRDSFCTNYRTRQVPNGVSCSGKPRTCHTKYKTVYKSIYAWETRFWVTSKDLNMKWEIKRPDHQGAVTPARYASVRKGDNTSTKVDYVNYIKGAKDSLFHEKFKELAEIAYPKINNYYKANRVIYAATPVKPAFWRQWNKSFETVNAAASKKGANAVLVITGHSKQWAVQLAQGWDAHNINDVVTVIGVDKQQNIKWVDSRSWSANSIITVQIRDEVLALGKIDQAKINAIIKQSILQNFVLQDMSKFKYLADDIPPPTWSIILALLMIGLGTPTLVYVFNRYEIL
jgi:hypothetical protein